MEGQRERLPANNGRKTKGNDRYKAEKRTSGISDKGENNKLADK